MEQDTRKKALKFARIGAIFYILWGVLHVLAAFYILPPATEGLEPSATLGRVQQNSVLMGTIGIATVWIAISKNWRNDRFLMQSLMGETPKTALHRFGFWLNLFLVSATDLAFIFFVLIPGWEPLPLGLIGPSLWILATITSSIGIKAKSLRPKLS